MKNENRRVHLTRLFLYHAVEVLFQQSNVPIIQLSQNIKDLLILTLLQPG
jgi:hypothetical protein